MGSLYGELEKKPTAFQPRSPETPRLYSEVTSSNSAVQRNAARMGGNALSGISILPPQSGDNVIDAAHQGTRAPASRLPHFARLQSAFGSHDLSGVKAHFGEQASASNQALSANAYTFGNHAVFSQQPNLWTAAHEAAHIVQQRSGNVHIPGRLGTVGDKWERHADQVADRVSQGGSAQGLLDSVASPQSGSSPAVQATPVVQRVLKQPLAAGSGWDAVLAQARTAEPMFRMIVDGLIKETRTRKDSYTKSKRADNGTMHYEQVPYSGMGPLKTRDRAVDKVRTDYGGNYRRLLDVVRATLTYDNFGWLAHALRYIARHSGDPEYGYEIVRCKQSFYEVKPQVYGDVKLNLRELSSGHICELQLNVKEFVDAKNKRGHKNYKKIRRQNPHEKSLRQLWSEKTDDIDTQKQYHQYQRSIYEAQDIYGTAMAHALADRSFFHVVDQVNDMIDRFG